MQAEAEAALDTILDTLDRTDPPSHVDAEVDRVCSAIWRSPERLMMIRALLVAIFSKDNPYRITPEAFAKMFGRANWLPFATPGPSPAALRGFLGQGPEQRTKNARILASYLYGALVLLRRGHPCFSPPVPTVLARYCEPLRALEGVVQVDGENRTAFNRAEVIRMGHEFYHLMSRGGHGVTEPAFAPILSSDLFANLKPATSDAELDDPDFLAQWTAIRLGLSGENYVASKLTLSLIRPELAKDLFETFIYVRTWMRPTPSSDAIIRSHGFMIPRNSQLYLAQYHLQGYGLNIITLSQGQLADSQLKYRAGLILAVDRQHNMGSLASKIAFVRLNRPDLLIGDFSRAALARQIKLDGANVNVDELTDYLHSVGEVSIKPLPNPEADVSGGAGRTGSAPISTWRELAAYVERPDIAARIAELQRSENDLTGYLHKPLRGP